MIDKIVVNMSFIVSPPSLCFYYIIDKGYCVG
ncbi:hypothetical protein [Enterococcus phage vB_Efm8_KEN21]